MLRPFIQVWHARSPKRNVDEFSLLHAWAQKWLGCKATEGTLTHFCIEACQAYNMCVLNAFYGMLNIR